MLVYQRVLDFLDAQSGNEVRQLFCLTATYCFDYASHATQRFGVSKPSLDTFDCWGWVDSIKQSKRYFPNGGILILCIWVKQILLK
jgi:hypothetical protein